MRHPVLIGIGLIALGIGGALLVYLQPAGLHAPLWVAEVALAAFPLAGALLIARETQCTRLVNWLAALILAGFVVIATWIAIASEGQCSFSLALIAGGASTWMCRGAFACAALINALFLAFMIRRALRHETV